MITDQAKPVPVIRHQSYPALLKTLTIEKLKQDLAIAVEYYSQSIDGFAEFYRQRVTIIQAELVSREERL